MSTKLFEAYLHRPEICLHPVFIIGSPRSGTTALALALAEHSQLWTSGESYVLHDLFGDRRPDKAFQQALELSEWSWLKAQGVDKSEFLGFLGLGLNALFSSRAQGKRWVDHTPHYALMGETLAEMFPGAHFLHILRDGRRVVHSMINFLRTIDEQSKVAELIRSRSLALWATDFREACRTWQRSVEAAMTLCANHPTRCVTVVNEELIQNPHRCFSQIFQLIGVPFEDRPIDYFRSHRINSSFAQGGPSKPHETNQINNPWTEWNAEQRSIFLEEAGPTMKKYGLAGQDEPVLCDYDRIVLRIRDVVRSALRPGSRVAVVSKGDSALLNFDGLKAEHFPQADDGGYAGHHPGSSAEAVAQLESLRANGVEFLLFPDTSLWWLDHYIEFTQHLELRYRVAAREEGVCLVYALAALETAGVHSETKIQTDKEKTDAGSGSHDATTAEILACCGLEAGSVNDGQTHEFHDGLPMPPAEFRELISGQPDPDGSDYLRVGSACAAGIRVLLAKNGMDVNNLQSILDFGCGAGRVIRHFRPLKGCRLFGSDLNPELVTWCRTNLPFAEFNVNQPCPPLRYSSETFDFVYAFSVFTHMPEEAQFLWMNELARVLKAGAHLLITVHGEAYTTLLSESDKGKFRAGQLVVHNPEAAGIAKKYGDCSAFHPHEYVKEKLAREHGFVVIDQSTGELMSLSPRRIGQDRYLLRKR